MATLMIDLYVSALVGVASLRWSKNLMHLHGV